MSKIMSCPRSRLFNSNSQQLVFIAWAAIFVARTSLAAEGSRRGEDVAPVQELHLRVARWLRFGWGNTLAPGNYLVPCTGMEVVLTIEKTMEEAARLRAAGSDSPAVKDPSVTLKMEN